MKIKHNFKCIPFVELKQGDVFIFKDDFYIKTSSEGRINVAGLADGELFCFEDEDKVIPCDAELTINRV